MGGETTTTPRLTSTPQGRHNAQIDHAQPQPSRSHPGFDGLPGLGRPQLGATRETGPRRASLVDELATNLQCYAGLRLTGLWISVGTLELYDWIFARAWFVLPSGWVTWLAVFVVFDLLFYGVHRLSHTHRWLWASHAVHHQGRFMNLSLAVRQSWTHVHLIWPVFMPLALLGVSGGVLLSVATVSSIYQLVIHTERVRRLPWPIEWVFNTPSHHRVHHERGVRSCNHGAVLIVWDRLFGTFEAERSGGTTAYGIEGGYEGADPFVAQWAPLARVLGRTRPAPGVGRPNLTWAVLNLVAAFVVRYTLPAAGPTAKLCAVAAVFASMAWAARAGKITRVDGIT